MYDVINMDSASSPCALLPKQKGFAGNYRISLVLSSEAVSYFIFRHLSFPLIFMSLGHLLFMPTLYPFRVYPPSTRYFLPLQSLMNGCVSNCNFAPVDYLSHLICASPSRLKETFFYLFGKIRTRS
jgi:hypothetical protein